MATNQRLALPITVLTGFLGSGKTTLLRALLAQPAFAQTLVLVNELGEIGIDHLLVKHVAEQLVLLESGCLCCTLRGDLVEQLGRLWREREAGTLPAFKRVIVETTGLADPAPILATLLSHPELSSHFFVDGVIATLDAEHGLAALSKYPECQKQLSVADRILITKVDRVDAASLAALKQAVDREAPGVPVHEVTFGAIAPREILGVGHLDTRGIVALAQHEHEHGHGHEHTHVHSISVTLARPISFPSFSWWVALTTQLHGDHILRLKAVISAQGEDTPIAVQAVQHVVYPPLNLPAMPELQGQSHVVLLTTGLDPNLREALRASLLALEAAPSA